MAAFTTDQFMHVKCKFQLTSESSDSATETLHSTNNERVRLCTSVDIDKHSTLIVMVCSNDVCNNHIIAYYIEKRRQHHMNHLNQLNHHHHQQQQQQLQHHHYHYHINHHQSPRQQQQQQHRNSIGHDPFQLTSNADAADCSVQASKQQQHLSISPKQQRYNSAAKLAPRIKPRVIVKQIYYHTYNEDIVAISLSSSGSQLVLINASSTIYVIPIKNILLNLHSKQLRSSQGRSMYFYDAKIFNCCTIESPTSVAYWESDQGGSMSPPAASSPDHQSGPASASPVSPSSSKAFVIVANKQGRISFVSVDTKTELCSTKVGEHISKLDIIRDRLSHSLLITCASYRQYRLPLELIQPQQQHHHQSQQHHYQHNNDHMTRDTAPASNLPKSHIQQFDLGQDPSLTDKDIIPAWDRKPTLIKLHNGNSPISAGATASAAAALQRVFIPQARYTSQSNLLTGFNTRERSLPMLFYHPPSMISVIDVLGAHRSVPPAHQTVNSSNNIISNNNSGSSVRSSWSSSSQSVNEARHMRFFSSRQYYYRVQKPLLVCKINFLDADEMILHVVLTDRLLAITTDHNRCLIMSRGCCDLRQPANAALEVDPIVKEIAFNNEEKIKLLIKSPASRDQDGIIDSFLLVTTKSIYSFEARQSCRDMYINMIDSHLSLTGLDKTTDTALAAASSSNMSTNDDTTVNHFMFTCGKKRNTSSESATALEDSKSSLIINNFLNQRNEIYERITYDSRAFSRLFRLDLNSLYEAYADRSLMRGRYDLANRFFQMARFDHTKILGKYLRLGAYDQSIQYCIKVLSDDNEILDECERLDLSKAAFDCLLAKTLVERSKLALYKTPMPKECLERLEKFCGPVSTVAIASSNPILSTSAGDVMPGVGRPVDNYNYLFSLCDHSPQCQGSKLSAATIVGDENDLYHRSDDKGNHKGDNDTNATGAQQEDEDTITGDQSNKNSQPPQNKPNCQYALLLDSNNKCRRNLDRLGCERALVDFVRLHVPPSLHSYVMTHLADFDLLELVESMINSEYRIPSILKALMRTSNDTYRLIFRPPETAYQSVFDKLTTRKECAQLVGIDNHKPKFLEFITSPEATKSMVRNISLASEYLGYRHTFVQFRRYSFTASHQFDSYRKLVTHYQKQNGANRDKQQQQGTASRHKSSVDAADSHTAYRSNNDIRPLAVPVPLNKIDDEIDRNNGAFGCNDNDKTMNDYDGWFSEHQRQFIGSMFVIFLNAALDESTEDACRLWFNYINFYLNYVGTLKQLEHDILEALNGNQSDCRFAITLYKAILRDENLASSKTFFTDCIANTPLESLEKFYSPSKLFENEFLMRLLEKTLDLIQQSPDIADALSIAAMC